MELVLLGLGGIVFVKYVVPELSGLGSGGGGGAGDSGGDSSSDSTGDGTSTDGTSTDVSKAAGKSVANNVLAGLPKDRAPTAQEITDLVNKQLAAHGIDSSHVPPAVGAGLGSGLASCAGLVHEGAKAMGDCIRQNTQALIDSAMSSAGVGKGKNVQTATPTSKPNVKQSNVKSNLVLSRMYRSYYANENVGGISSFRPTDYDVYDTSNIRNRYYHFMWRH